MRAFGIAFFLCFNCIFVFCQKTIEGSVKTIDGHPVEYATISVDSIYTLSDVEGRFSLLLPEGHTQNLCVTHISYKAKEIPRSTYCLGNLDITLEEAVNELASITITGEKKTKLKAISGTGMRIPGGDACFSNEHNGVKELGPIIKADQDFQVENITLKILSDTYTKCTLRVILYEINGKNVTPIISRPLYAEAIESADSYSLAFTPEEQIELKKGHKYFAGLSIVNSSKEGELHIPAYLHSGMGHNTLTENMRQIPASIGLKILGRTE